MMDAFWTLVTVALAAWVGRELYLWRKVWERERACRRTRGVSCDGHRPSALVVDDIDEEGDKA